MAFLYEKRFDVWDRFGIWGVFFSPSTNLTHETFWSQLSPTSMRKKAKEKCNYGSVLESWLEKLSRQTLPLKHLLPNAPVTEQYGPESTFPGPQIPLWEMHKDHTAVRTVPSIIHRTSTSPQARQGPQQDRERHSSPPTCCVPFKRHTHSLAQRRSLIQCSLPQKGKWTHGYLGTQPAWP